MSGTWRRWFTSPAPASGDASAATADSRAGVVPGWLQRLLAGPVAYRDGVPVLPGALPLLGHSPGLSLRSAELLAHARRRLGPLYYLHLGPTVGWRLTCAGEGAFEILRSRTAYIPLTTNTATEDFLGRQSLLVLRGEQHHRMRAALNPPFVPRGLSLSGIGELMADCIETRLAKLPHGRPLRILAETQSLALELIFRLINVPLAELDEWQRQYRRFMEVLLPIPWDLPGLPRHRALIAKRWLDERLAGILNHERQSPPTSSLVSVLAHARDEAGAPLGLTELGENLRLLILAGHETTASVLAWMVVELARDPALLAELCAEAQRVGSIPTTPQAAKSCPLAEGLFRETLRLYPPAYITIRTLGEELTVYGRALPKGQTIAIALGDLGRDELIFPEPERFDPRRWTAGARARDPVRDRNPDRASPQSPPAPGALPPPSPLETAQFGGGPHFCLGYHLAVFEGTQFAIGLALHLLRRGLRLRLCGGPPRSIYYPLHHPSARTEIELA